LGAGIERIWDFYLELSASGNPKYANWLLIAIASRGLLSSCNTWVGQAPVYPYPPPFAICDGFLSGNISAGHSIERRKQLNPFHWFSYLIPFD